MAKYYVNYNLIKLKAMNRDSDILLDNKDSEFIPDLFKDMKINSSTMHGVKIDIESKVDEQTRSTAASYFDHSDQNYQAVSAD